MEISFFEVLQIENGKSTKRVYEKMISHRLCENIAIIEGAKSSRQNTIAIILFFF